MKKTRRQFLEAMAVTTGSAILMPTLHACKDDGTPIKGPKTPTGSRPKAGPDVTSNILPAPPVVKPADWNAMAYNRERGAKGAIPDSYMPDILGENGDAKHLGKHLPYIPELTNSDTAKADWSQGVAAGMIPIMWGDPKKGHAKHPNAPKNKSNNFEGHWYNWIRIRKATDADAKQVESRFSNWPTTGPDDSGMYTAPGGGSVEEDGGRNTIYLVGMPPDCKTGDVVRIWAHCLTHGEYVDFIKITLHT